jgi:hypothetical protein
VRSDLDDAAGCARGIHHRPAFHDGVADRLLDVDVRAGFDGGNHRQRVPMVRRAHNHDLRLRLREQLPVIFEGFWRFTRALADVGERCFELPRVDVAERDNLASAARHRFAEDVVAPPPAADERGPILFRTGLVGGPDGKRQSREGGGSGGTLEEMATIHGEA